jgi:NitT/TauT family transport system permease protein
MDLNPSQTQVSGQPRRSVAADFLVVIAILGGLFGVIAMGHEFNHPFQSEATIDLSPWYLPFYTFLSFLRGATAYVLSFIFTLFYARWAAYDKQAEKFLIPLLDILQSMPLSAFLVPIEITLVALFPHNNIGIELSCIIVIFTGQVWNMTFSFYYSLKALPADFGFVGKLARFTPWQRFTQVELPFATKGLVYNSMISVAGGWFFISIIEAFNIGDQNYRVKGVGSYMSVAQDQKDYWAQFYAVLAVVIMVVAIDQLIWRPLIVWSNRFKLEDTESEFQESSAVLRYYNRSRVIQWLSGTLKRLMDRPVVQTQGEAPIRPPNRLRRWNATIPWRPIFYIIALVMVAFGGFSLLKLLWQVTFSQWMTILFDLFITLIRVLSAIGLSTLIAVPIGVWIGSNPKLAKFLMPLTQIAASFPAPFVFPNLVLLIYMLHGNLQWGAVVLMMLGTVWYILFNVISGASAIPQDLRACTQLTHLQGWQKWRTLYLPGIFPALTTGWITAAGGAWNASIVSEYVQYQGKTETATGLGALIQEATDKSDFPTLAASVLAMALFVVVFNRLVWKRLSAIAQERYQLLT